MTRRHGAGGGVDWRRLPLEKLVDIVGGGTPSKSRAEFWSGSTPWVSPKDMNVREIVDTTGHISAAEQSATRLVPAGSILRVGGIRASYLLGTPATEPSVHPWGRLHPLYFNVEYDLDDRAVKAGGELGFPRAFPFR